MTGAGSLVAVALLLVANRVPVSAAVERQVFWYAWLAACAVCVLGREARVLWRGLIAFSGVCTALVPLLGLVTRDHAYDAWRNVAVERAVDRSLFGLGILLAWLGWSLRGWASDRAPAPRQTTNSALGSVNVA